MVGMYGFQWGCSHQWWGDSAADGKGRVGRKQDPSTEEEQDPYNMQILKIPPLEPFLPSAVDTWLLPSYERFAFKDVKLLGDVDFYFNEVVDQTNPSFDDGPNSSSTPPITFLRPHDVENNVIPFFDEEFWKHMAVPLYEMSISFPYSRAAMKTTSGKEAMSAIQIMKMFL